VGSLTTPYTCLYQPVFDPDLPPERIRSIGAAFGRYARRWPHVRLDALDPPWPGLEPFLHGCRAAGLLARRFDHFGNWHEPVAGLSYAEYLAGRPGDLRETIRRKTRRAERDPSIAWEILRDHAGLEPGIEAFESVYRRSWKESEPAPRFNAALMRALAGRGKLRLGILRHQGRPIAVQYWLVEGGVASVLKLAHDEAEKQLSPGTLLTAWMIRSLLELDRVAELDFGRGDDPYKRAWTSQRRQRIGVMLINPYRVAGVSILARHMAGGVRRAMRQR
jgi:hypothetical protein